MALRSLFNPMGAGSYYRIGQEVVPLKTSGKDVPLTLYDSGIYEIAIVGGGGGPGACASNYYHVYYNQDRAVWACGGSGAGFVGTVFLAAGQYYYTVGSGGAYVGAAYLQNYTGGVGKASVLKKDSTVLIEAGGGGGGAAKTNATGKYTSASGGTLTNNIASSNIKAITVSSNGGQGTAAILAWGQSGGGTPGAPVWTGDDGKGTYGKGGYGMTAGKDGCFRLIFRG